GSIGFRQLDSVIKNLFDFSPTLRSHFRSPEAKISSSRHHYISSAPSLLCAALTLDQFATANRAYDDVVHSEIGTNRYAAFLKAAAVCSMIGGITTLVLAMMPAPQASGFEQQAALYTNKIYLARLWIFFFHPQLNIIAALGIGVLLLKDKAVLVI